MRGIPRLRHTEFAEFDRTNIEVLVYELGEPGAERVVGRALEELSLRLERIECAYRARDVDDVLKAVNGVSAIASQIGMTGFARAGRHVVAAGDASDSAALAATIERLIRVGEASLLSVWGAKDVRL